MRCDGCRPTSSTYTWILGWNSRGAGLIAGTIYAFYPFRFIQLSHIQLLATGWLPIAPWPAGCGIAPPVE